MVEAAAHVDINAAINQGNSFQAYYPLKANRSHTCQSNLAWKGLIIFTVVNPSLFLPKCSSHLSHKTAGCNYKQSVVTTVFTCAYLSFLSLWGILLVFMRGKQIKKTIHRRGRLTNAEGGNVWGERLEIVQPFTLPSLVFSASYSGGPLRCSAIRGAPLKDPSSPLVWVPPTP